MTGNRHRSRVARLTESVESRLWPLPLAAVIASVALGIVLPRIDLLVDGTLPNGVDSVFFNGGAQTARSVLSSIAGSLITATSLTFSLTVVALQLASSQASPRVLRLFARDRQVHVTLAVFLGTFAYSVTVLRSVTDAADQVTASVPRISVTVGFVLTLASVVMLVFFLAHLAAQLRVETILKDIHSETDRTIDLVTAQNSSLRELACPAVKVDDKMTVESDSSGFLTSRDRPLLIDFARDRGIVIEELRQVGDNFVVGTPLARWWVTDPDSAVDPTRVAEVVNRAHSHGYERTAAQDVDYGVEQLVDIGVRALSPGINDPTTAVHALGHLGAVVARALDVPPVPAGLADSDGRLRLVTFEPPRVQVIHDALSQIRHYGAGDPLVVRRILQLVGDLAYTNGDSDVRGALLEQLDTLSDQLRDDSTDPRTSRLLRDEIADVSSRIRPQHPAE